VQGRSPKPLRTCIETPADDAEGVEGTARVIWDAMLRVASKSQSVTRRTGHLVRIEAARTDLQSFPAKPLQAYMHQDAELERHVEPCQRILMFFARTQVPHEWESPPYRFNRRQRAAWEALWRAAQDNRDSPEPMETEGEEGDDDADQLQPVEARCMEFFIELLNQRIQSSEYECALVCALAVLGVSDHDGGKPWKDAHSYPPILSNVMKISRFIIVHKAFLLDPNARDILRAERGRLEGEWTVPSPMEDPEYRFGDDEGYSGSPPATPPPGVAAPPGWSSSPGFGSPPRLISLSQQAQQGRKTFREWIRTMVTTFMIHGTASPMEWMLDLRRYGMKIHYNTPSDGHIGWEGHDQLSYKTLKFTMGHFRGFVHGLAASTRQILVEKVLMCTPDQIPAIPWDRMGDDFNEPKAGWSFLQDARTPWPVHGPRWMSQRVRQERKLQQWFIQPREGRFSIDGIERFMGFVAEFKEKLAVICHISGGQPARGPELLSIRHRNTAAGGQRNIFIEDGLVACVTRYHKGFYASNDAKVIHRYLPRAVGELVVWYLWLVLPFVEQLQAYHQQMCQSAAIPDTQASKVWGVDAVTGREWTSVRLRDALARESKKRLHNALNLASYRDIAIAISRRYFSNAKPFPHNVREDGTAVDGDGDGDGEVDEDAMDDEQWMRHMADLQAAHTPHVAEMVYGRMMSQQQGTTAGRQAGFRASSVHWHGFLGFDVPDSAVRTLGKRPQPRWKDEGVMMRDQRRDLVEQTNMTEAMQRMTGRPEMQFRPIQAAAIRSIQAGDDRVVAVMPTGGGKSMLFMLPAWVAGRGGLTVVVVPLTSLRQDLRERCQAFGISCVEWESHRHPDHAQVVLVTPESAFTDGFQTFLNRQREFIRLDRIVVDECHIMLNESPTFRPTFQQLGRLHQCGTQMVFLTATLPPRDEARLFQRMYVARDEVSFHRGRTSRHNVAYRVHRPSIAAAFRSQTQWVEQPSVQRFMRERVRRAQPGRAIVYGSTKRIVTRVAEMFGCAAYYSDQDRKTGILEQFRRGDQGVIAATSALGMGVDIPDIRCIIHVGFPRSLLDYAQESGRAGRDGQPSEAIIIQPEEFDEFPQWFDQNTAREQEGLELVRRYMMASAPGCRRRVLDDYLDGPIDGYERQQCSDQDGPSGSAEQRCDGCDPDWEATESIASPMASPVANPIAVGFPARARAHKSPPTAHGAWDPASDTVMQEADGSSESDAFESQGARTPTAPSPVRRSGVPLEAQHRYHQQEISRTAIRERVQASAAQRLHDEEFLAQESRQWRGRCWLCVQAQRDDVQHDLWGCPAPESGECRRWVRGIRDHIQYTAGEFYCCYQCGMPQDICGGWEAGQTCGHRQFLYPMMAMLIHWEWPDRRQQGYEWWRRRLKGVGVRVTDFDAVRGYLSQRVDMGGIRGHTQLAQDYIWIRRLYEEHGY
jgi:superfamily II DNA or RNA helicase